MLEEVGEICRRPKLVLALAAVGVLGWTIVTEKAVPVCPTVLRLDLRGGSTVKIVENAYVRTAKALGVRIDLEEIAVVLRDQPTQKISYGAFLPCVRAHRH